MGLRVSHVAAMVVLGGVAGWMWSGQIIEGGTGPREGEAVVIAERNEAAEARPFAVRTRVLAPEARRDTLVMRGRTEADAEVPVRVETNGTVRERLVEKGAFVTEGMEVCRLDRGTREAVLRQAEATRAQAEAQLQQARFDLDSNQKLADKGFAAESGLNALRAAANAAEAQVAQAEAQIAQAEEELARTVVVASASGIVQDPVAEVGDVLQAGGVCVTLVDTDPLLVTGQVAETEVGALRVGIPAQVRLVTGEEVDGTIRFISPAADPETRTFAVEIAIENDENRLRAGVTATAAVPLPEVEAYPVLASWLTLDDAGRIGVGTVADDGTVAFSPVAILAQEPEFTWVTGLEPGTRVITLGAEYVVPGQRVAFTDQDATALPRERTASLRVETSTIRATEPVAE